MYGTYIKKTPHVLDVCVSAGASGVKASIMRTKSNMCFHLCTCILTPLFGEHAPGIVLRVALHQSRASQHLYHKSPARSYRCCITPQRFTDAKREAACGGGPTHGRQGSAYGWVGLYWDFTYALLFACIQETGVFGLFYLLFCRLLCKKTLIYGAHDQNSAGQRAFHICSDKCTWA